MPFPKRDIEADEADLVRIGQFWTEPLGDGWPEHQQFYQMLLWYAEERGYKKGWPFMKFQDKAKVKPPYNWNYLAPIPPSLRVLNWIRSRNIAYAKRRDKDRARAAT